MKTRTLTLTRDFASRYFLANHPDKAQQFEKEIRQIRKIKTIRSARLKKALTPNARLVLTADAPYTLAADEPFDIGLLLWTVRSRAVFAMLRSLFGAAAVSQIVELDEKLFGLGCPRDLFEAAFEAVNRREFMDRALNGVFVESPRIRDRDLPRPLLKCNVFYDKWGDFKVPIMVKILELLGKPSDVKLFLAGCRRK